MATKRVGKRAATKPVLLSGGNPQIAKADGDGPVQAYIAAMPGWKRDVGRHLDALIARTVPGVHKAVVKMTFAKGAALDDPTDLFNSSLEGNTRRAIDFHQGDKIDEKALKALIREATELNVSSRAAKKKPKSA